nr:hypothetical protein [Tanacetum cinerariifolium]
MVAGKGRRVRGGVGGQQGGGRRVRKAIELCVLIGAKVAVLVKSPGGKVYMLGEDLIDDWYGNDVVETGQPTIEFNKCYGDVSQELAVDNSSNSEQESNIRQLEEMKKDAVDELKMNNNILEKLGSEEKKKNLVMEDDNDLMMINNSQPMFDSDLSLDMSWSDSNMSWLDSDTIDMSWIDTYSEHGVNLNFHLGVEVLNRNIPAKMGSEEIKKNLVVEDDNDSMIINNTQAVLDSDEM